MKPELRIEELRQLLNKANFAYHVDAAPTLADSEFDYLMAELIELETAHPEFKDQNSPSQRVGGEPIDAIKKVEHTVPMQSIDKTCTIEDLNHWYEKVSGNAETPPTITADPKIDGIAISLRYEAGALISAISRGNGIKGNDVTEQAKTVCSIPLLLRGDFPKLLEVRGEIFMPNKSFDAVNEAREAAGEQLFANARNATSGTVHSLDPAVVSERNLAFFAHGKGGIDWEEMPDSWSSFTKSIQSFGIPVNEHLTVCNSMADITDAVDTLKELRSSLGYGIDGIVLRVDSFTLQDSLGATSKAPRWCIAFKYPAEQGKTTLIAVDWPVGKNGTLTPRATMEPINLAGTVVQHASLHNIDEIHRKDIRVGDEVIVQKAGDIIPQVVKVADNDGNTSRSAEIKPPSHCPVCDGPVEKEGPKLYCVNPECPEQFREKVKWFVSRDQMNIDGLGEKVVDKLIDAGLIHHFADLYALKESDLLPLERFAKKSSQGIVQSIADSKTQGLTRVLASVGIRLVGRATAKVITSQFNTMDLLLDATVDEFEALPDVGRITAETIYTFLHSDQGQLLFDRLKGAGVLLVRTESVQLDGEFVGKAIVLTGSLQQWHRTALKEILETKGAKVTSTVSKNTDLVIAGDKAGSKLQKAHDLGVEVWDESRLLKALSE